MVDAARELEHLALRSDGPAASRKTRARPASSCSSSTRPTCAPPSPIACTWSARRHPASRHQAASARLWQFSARRGPADARAGLADLGRRRATDDGDARSALRPDRPRHLAAGHDRGFDAVRRYHHGQGDVRGADGIPTGIRSVFVAGEAVVADGRSTFCASGPGSDRRMTAAIGPNFFGMPGPKFRRPHACVSGQPGAPPVLT